MHPFASRIDQISNRNTGGAVPGLTVAEEEGSILVLFSCSCKAHENLVSFFDPSSCLIDPACMPIAKLRHETSSRQS